MKQQALERNAVRPRPPRLVRNLLAMRQVVQSRQKDPRRRALQLQEIDEMLVGLAPRRRRPPGP